jgi:phage baseplate assembly protein W
MTAKQPNLFGQGPGFPLRVAGDGRLAWSQGEDNVRESMRIILLTEPGERILREDFGCGLTRFLAEPNTPATHQRIRDTIQRNLTRWEPRISLDEVQVQADPEAPSRARVTILFRLVATQEPGRLGLDLVLEG